MREIEAHLMPEDAQRSGAGAVGLARAAIEDGLEQVEVGLHGDIVLASRTMRPPMHHQNNLLHIGGLSTADLASQFGTPLYIYDAAVIRRQLAKVRGAFADLPFQPFYAMKANGNLSLLRLIREQGFGCDAV